MPKFLACAVVMKAYLLFDAKPRVLVLGPFHGLETAFTMIGLCGLLVVFVGFAQHQPIVSQTEGVFVNGHGI